MALKKYQPGRTDLLINADWGVPLDGLDGAAARASGLSLFHGRWITRQEKKRLRDEHHAYRSIRAAGLVLMLLPCALAPLTAAAGPGTVPAASLAALYCAIMLASGIGLSRFWPRSRYPSLAVFLSFAVLPAIPPPLDDYLPFIGVLRSFAFLLVPLGVTGLYSIGRRTAGRILDPARKGPE